MKTALTPTLQIAYEESGPAEGPPVVLLHGFPDDVRAYDGVAPALAAAGWRRTENRCAGCYGSCGRRTGGLTMPLSSGPRPPSTIPLLSRW